MEEEWRTYLRDNAPELYQQALDSLNHECEWRDRRIQELEGMQAAREEHSDESTARR